MCTHKVELMTWYQLFRTITSQALHITASCTANIQHEEVLIDGKHLRFTAPTEATTHYPTAQI